MATNKKAPTTVESPYWLGGDEARVFALTVGFLLKQPGLKVKFLNSLSISDRKMAAAYLSRKPSEEVKAAAKQTAAKKPAAKKPVAKKTVAKKSSAKKTTPSKAKASKVAAKKATAKPVARKPAARRTATKKAVPPKARARKPARKR